MDDMFDKYVAEALALLHFSNYCPLFSDILLRVS